MERHELERYLSARLGGAVRIESLTQAFPGLSRETWLVRLESGTAPGSTHERLVVRADAPGGPFCPVPLEFEYRVYRALAGTEVPVARALWFDASPEVTKGRALFVREMIEGSTLLPGLADDTEEAAQRRKRIALEHAGKLALIHRIDWRALGFADFMRVPATDEAAPRDELLHWWKVWDEVRTASFPIVTEALHWFARHLPPRAARVCLCKGQNGIGEEIWRDDRIVAFSDWELANIGDPCQDFALSQGMLKLWDRRRIIEHYEREAGYELPARNIDYYIVWNAFKSLLALNNGLRGFLDGEDPRLARATLGYGKAKVYEHMLGEILPLDVHAAADLVLSRQPNPYHNRRIAEA